MKQEVGGGRTRGNRRNFEKNKYFKKLGQMFGKVESESILESKKPRLKGKILGFGWVRRQLGAGGDRKRKVSGRHGVLMSIESGPSRHEEAGRVDVGVKGGISLFPQLYIYITGRSER